MLRKILLSFLTAILCLTINAQVITNKAILQRTAVEHRKVEDENRNKAFNLAKAKGWPTELKLRHGSTATLVGVDQFGFPLYKGTQNNIIAAATVGADKLWTGGSSGLNLNGSSASVKDKLAIWDGGAVLATHVELAGRILQKDSPTTTSDHTTHVTGTLMATGINPLAKGMANGLQELIAYDYQNDYSEMSSEAAGLLLSNHSYGYLAGWNYNNTKSRWEFYGRSTDNEDYKFGYYDSNAQMLDSIAFNAPYYLIVKSAGNSRDENGPAVGQSYFRYNSSGVMADAGNRPAGISNNDGYDILVTTSTAKNILTVGAVGGIPQGFSNSTDVSLTSFSAWGPTDDGRIKPDVVADGTNVLSTTNTSNTAYETMSGTSMSSPNASGSLLLLQEYYNKLHPGTFMKAATLKGLAIHTADEAGDYPGPDYKFGWGLLDVAKAAEVIKSNNSGTHMIYENVLNNGDTYSINVVASGQGPLVATISWTDPKGNVEVTDVLNNRTKKLVNDLDIKITQGNNTYLPWTLDPLNPSSPAVPGNNNTDNVERINIDKPVPGVTYTIQVTHKNILQRGSQAYSLILSGVGGQAYCTSAPSSTTGARIDSVAFGSIQKANVTGCTTYSINSATSGAIQPGQVLPLVVKVSSCDASNANKIVKAYIDYNNNGSFADPGELVATSGIITGAGTFTGTITTPNTLVPGNSTILRIVTEETSNASDINPCGSYGNGETQDYRLDVVAPSSDMSMVDVIAPAAGACGNQKDYITVRFKNNGIVSKQNFPLTITIKNGTTTVARYIQSFTATAPAGVFSDYTFPAAITLSPSTTYSIEAIISDATDQMRQNDTLRKQVTIAAQAAAPNGLGEICGTSAILQISNFNNESTYYWYTSPTGVPFTSGTNLTTATIPANNTYYLAEGARATLGPVNKMVFSDGGYNAFSGNNIKITADAPTIIETARLYIGSSGTIKFVVNPMASDSTYYPSQGDSVTLRVSQTAPTTPVLGNPINDPNDTGAVYRLNLKLDNSVKNKYILWIFCSDGASIYRNNNITTSPYPFSVPGLVSITKNSATDPSDPNFYQKYYYFFYDTKVRSLNTCPSTMATVVVPVASTPVITQAGDSLVSSIAVGNQWYLNGNTISGAFLNTYKPTQTGSYTVTTFDNFACSRTSAAFNYTITAINPVQNAEVDLKIAPVPNNGHFTISMNLQKRDNLRIDLVNSQGQSIVAKSYPNFTGHYMEQWNVPTLSSGVYLIKIQQGDKTWYNKILIQK
jgi:hypothetical protein